MSSARSRGWLVPFARALALATFALATTLATSTARADGPYEGTWREGPMRIDVAVTSWGGDCGPRPQSTSTAGGGTFQITQEGDHLTFQMRRPRTTRGCWSENRAVRRVSSSAQTGTWRIVCRTPPDDSRGETGTYTLRAIGDDRITFRDVSAYDWQLNTSRCLATITTTQTFTRVSSTPPEETPPEEDEEEERCTPGAAARLIVRPASAELTPGGQQCFTTRVVDRRGCALRGQRVTLELADGAGRIEGRCYEATDGEGGARIVARAGALTDEARVSVRAIDLSDLIARRTETGSVGGGVPSPEAASADTEARVSATEREGVDLLWPALGLGVALFLVLFGVLALARRRKPAPTPEPDRASLYPEAVAPPQDGEDMICPTCRRGFPPGEVRCPQDDTALVPYREFAAATTDHGNICPTCGTRYPSSTKFCGKDGATLEPATAENDTQ